MELKLHYKQILTRKAGEKIVNKKQQYKSNYETDKVEFNKNILQ